MRSRVLPLSLLLVASLRSSAGAQAAPKADEIIPRDAVVARSVGDSRTAPIHTDLLEAEIVAGRWRPPQPGDVLRNAPGQTSLWEKASFGQDGILKHAALAGGYAYVPVTIESAGVWLLEAAGHAMVYVNGEPRVGDIYSSRNVRVPVSLKKGANDLLFHCVRGQVEVRLVKPQGDTVLHSGATTLPDILEGSAGPYLGSIVVINATERSWSDLTLHAGFEGAEKAIETPVPKMAPLSIRAAAFTWEGQPPANSSDKTALRLVLKQGGVAKADTTVSVRVLSPDKSHKRTFRSDIDGSVQYYAVTPAMVKEKARTPGLVLTLHGAGVEAIGQASSYGAKEWAHIVAPTNRKPFGFDWEDWGRLDALEVLEMARKELGTDPRRTWLTGHSMGGHGTWHLGATYPDRWAAIGPSAGWVSLWTYGRGPRQNPKTPLETRFFRANHSSDTPRLLRNLLTPAVYVLHGQVDESVPVNQAGLMKHLLEPGHKDFHYREVPKMGHWWGGQPEGGCVDWKPMFDLFRDRTLPAPADVLNIDFSTANPGVSGRFHWAEIVAQAMPLEVSGVRIKQDAMGRSIQGTTENVARLMLHLDHWESNKAIRIELDGQTLDGVPWPKDARLRLEKSTDKWQVASWRETDKSPGRYGPFRDVYRNRVLFVVGTRGTAEETAWAWAKARYDAEVFWYRGNGSIDIIADHDFPMVKHVDRNVVLFGNADTLACWDELLGVGPVQVKRGGLSLGKKKMDGDNLACLFIRPRPGSERALVGVVGGTGLPGMRLTERLPIFATGMPYPDCVILSTEMLATGYGGVRAAGYFGLDWSLTGGDFAFSR